MNKPLFTIITGTNGVGKSTFGKKFEKETKIPFINPDLHYKNKFGGYYNFTRDQMTEASNELKQKREDFFKDKKSFAIERILDHESVISKLAKQAHRNSNHFIKIYDRRNDHVKFEAAHKPKWAKDLIDNSFTLQKDKGIDLSR